jgi:hypothetical protein
LAVSGRIDEHDLNNANEPPHVVAHGAALILPQAGDDRQRYRVRIAGFPNEQEASALGARLKEMHPRLEPIASLR